MIFWPGKISLLLPSHHDDVVSRSLDSFVSDFSQKAQYSLLSHCLFPIFFPASWTFTNSGNTEFGGYFLKFTHISSDFKFTAVFISTIVDMVIIVIIPIFTLIDVTQVLLSVPLPNDLFQELPVKTVPWTDQFCQHQDLGSRSYTFFMLISCCISADLFWLTTPDKFTNDHSLTLTLSRFDSECSVLVMKLTASIAYFDLKDVRLMNNGMKRFSIGAKQSTPPA